MGKVSEMSDKRFLVLVCCISFLMFALFSGKHFSLDSPVSIHVARQLSIDPIDPPLGEFGKYLINWNKTAMPQRSVFYSTPHPPLVQFYISPFIAIFGENEILLNWLMFPFYLLSVLFFFGCLRVLKVPFRRWITLLFSISPVAVINSHDIMVDIPLGCFTLGMFFFLFRDKNRTDILAAGVMAGLGLLTKITAGTMVLSAVAFYLTQKRWKSLTLYLIPVMILYGSWCFHNYLVYGTVQVLSNGHMEYLLGDIRYRFERMISYAGGTLVFPAVAVLLSSASRYFRKWFLLMLSGTILWSVLLMIHLDYSISSALFYALCSASGLIIIFAALVRFTEFRSPENKALIVHTVLQLIGGLFLTLYAVRYLTPLLLPLFLGIAYLLKVARIPNPRRFFLPFSLIISLTVTVFLSVGDVIHASIPHELSRDLSRQYDTDKVRYAGRLGYLYYLDRAGLQYCQPDQKPSAGEYVLHACSNPDDTYLLKEKGYTLTAVDTFTYRLFFLSPVGGKAGFYGNARLPYSLLFDENESVFHLFKVEVD